MSDLSFFVIRTEVIRQQAAAWKTLFGSILPMIDFVATSQPELLNELKKLGYKCYFNEKVYYDQVAPYLEKDGLVIADMSSNLAEEYLASLSKSGVSIVAVESVEDTKAYHAVLPDASFLLRVGASDKVFDCGCCKEEAVRSLRVAKEQGIPLSSFLFLCPSVKEADAVVRLMESLYEEAKAEDVCVDAMYVIGEGIQELASQSDAASRATFEKLKQLANQVSVSVDGSRFFIANAYTIYTHIIGKKLKTNKESRRILYYTDNGVYCSFFNAHIHKEPICPQPVTSRELSGELFDTTVFGPTCDSIDNLGDDFKLPELQIDDWLKYEGNGYRCSNYSARFNGFEDPDVIVV